MREGATTTKIEFGTDSEVLADILEAIGSAKLEYTRPEGTGWRVEVIQRGKAYIWRKGYGANRQSAKGAKFETLGEERKAQYYANVERRKAKPRVDTPDIPTGASEPRRRGRKRKDTTVTA